MAPPSPVESEAALIVGGSSGMGLSAAKLLHAKGIPVILVASSDAKLAAAKASFPAGPTVTTWQADLAQTVGWTEVIANVDALDAAVHVKYLVNAAGVFAPKPFLDNDEGDYEVSLRTA